MPRYARGSFEARFYRDMKQLARDPKQWYGWDDRPSTNKDGQPRANAKYQRTVRQMMQPESRQPSLVEAVTSLLPYATDADILTLYSRLEEIAQRRGLMG
jgi:hypothetical protein